MNPDLPLFEADLEHKSVIEPTELFDQPPAPSAAVLCHFKEVVSEAGRASRLHTQLQSVHGGRPVYAREHLGGEVAFFYPGLGAPAAASALEEAIAMGCRSFVAVGGAGGLVSEMALGSIVVAQDAIRDEGTSFHYAPAGRLSHADPDAVAALEQALNDAGLPFVVGRTWTTDAIYRETRPRVQRRVAENALTVEMEASALFAVANYRNVQLGQLLYAGDTLADELWDHRGWTEALDVRRALFEVAMTAASLLDGCRERAEDTARGADGSP